MEGDVNYTRSLKMNLTRPGYLRARSVGEGASEGARETATESLSGSPAGNITAPGVSPNSFFEKRGCSMHLLREHTPAR